jgi:hypothetical protein
MFLAAGVSFAPKYIFGILQKCRKGMRLVLGVMLITITQGPSVTQMMLYCYVHR